MPPPPGKRGVSARTRKEKTSDSKKKIALAIGVLLASIVGSSWLIKLNSKGRQQAVDPQDRQFAALVLGSCACHSISQPEVEARCTESMGRPWCYVNKSCPGAKMRTDAIDSEATRSDSSHPDGDSGLLYWKHCTPGSTLARPTLSPSLAQDVVDALAKRPLSVTKRNDLAASLPGEVKPSDDADPKAVFTRFAGAALRNCKQVIYQALGNPEQYKSYEKFVGNSLPRNDLESATNVVMESLQKHAFEDLAGSRSALNRRNSLLEYNKKAIKSIPLAKVMTTKVEKTTLIDIQEIADWDGLSVEQVKAYVYYSFYRSVLVTDFALQIAKQNRSQTRGLDDDKLIVIFFAVISLVLFWIGKGKAAALYKDWVKKDQTRKKLATSARKNALNDDQIKLPALPVQKPLPSRVSVATSPVDQVERTSLSTPVSRKMVVRRRDRKIESNPNRVPPVLDPAKLIEDWDEQTKSWVMKSRADKAADDLKRVILRKAMNSGADTPTTTSNSNKDLKSTTASNQGVSQPESQRPATELVGAENDLSTEVTSKPALSAGKDQATSDISDGHASDLFGSDLDNGPGTAPDVGGACNNGTVHHESDNKRSTENVTDSKAGTKVERVPVLKRQMKTEGRSMSHPITDQKLKKGKDKQAKKLTRPQSQTQALTPNLASSSTNKVPASPDVTQSTLGSVDTPSLSTTVDKPTNQHAPGPENANETSETSAKKKAKSKRKRKKDKTEKQKDTDSHEKPDASPVHSPDHSVTPKSSIQTSEKHVAQSSSDQRPATPTRSKNMDTPSSLTVLSEPREEETKSAVRTKSHSSVFATRKLLESPSHARQPGSPTGGARVVSAPPAQMTSIPPVTHSVVPQNPGYAPNFVTIPSSAPFTAPPPSVPVYEPGNIVYVNSPGQVMSPQHMPFMAQEPQMVPVMPVYPQPQQFIVNPNTGEVLPMAYEVMPQPSYVTQVAERPQQVMMSPQFFTQGYPYTQASPQSHPQSHSQPDGARS